MRPIIERFNLAHLFQRKMCFFHFFYPVCFMIGGLLVQYLPIIDLSIDICHERDVCCKYFSPKEGLFGQMQMQIYAICTICSTLQYNTICVWCRCKCKRRKKRTSSQMWPKKRRGAASRLKKFGNPLIGHCRPPHCDVIVKSSTYVVWNGLWVWKYLRWLGHGPKETYLAEIKRDRSRKAQCNLNAFNSFKLFPF